MAQLEVDYHDGSHETVVTDDSWKTSASPILRSDIYGGEVYDARLEQAGWEKADFDDSKVESGRRCGCAVDRGSSQIA